MRSNTLVQILLSLIFGTAFIGFGAVEFIHLSRSEHKYEATLESIRTGGVQPDTLVVVAKYVDPGKGAWPHIVFSNHRQPNVDVAATVDFFNGVKAGETVTAYYLSDGYFFPQNHRKVSASSKWFFLGLGFLLGAGVIIVSFAMAFSKQHHVPSDAA